MVVGMRTGEKKVRDICGVVWKGLGHWIDC